jgi:Matrixin
MAVGGSRFVVLLGVLAVALVLAPAASARPDAIEVCCAWNDALSDGQLTYKVQGGDDELRASASEGVQNWDAGSISGLALTEVFGSTKADVTIKLQRGGSPFIAGQTSRRFERLGSGPFADFFIKGVSVTIFGARSGSEVEVEQISAHEFGHALGAGHADAPGYLMSPSLDQIPANALPTACDFAAVREAQEWFFDNVGTPTVPSSDQVTC